MVRLPVFKFVVLIFAVLLGSTALQAGLVLDTTGAPGSTFGNIAYRPTSPVYGSGEKVTVATDTVLSDIAFDLALSPIGAAFSGTLTYMIWDAGNTSLLYSQSQTVTSASGWVDIPVSYTLTAATGSYYIGILAGSGTANNSLGLYYSTSSINYATNGLGVSSSSLFTNYGWSGGNPAYLAAYSIATGPTLALRLYSGSSGSTGNTGNNGTTPEPATFAMIGLALVGIGTRYFKHRA